MVTSSIHFAFVLRQISRAIDEVVMEERWVKYLDDLHNVIWDGDKLKEPLPEPTDEKKAEIKEEALRKLLDFIPSKFFKLILSEEMFRQLSNN